MAHPPPPPPLHSIPYRLTWGSAAWRAGALPSRNSWPFLHITEKIKFPTDISFGSRKLELVEIDTRHAAERDVGVCPPLAHPHMHRPSCDECRKRGVRFSAKVAICTTKGGECNERSFICSSKRCVLRCPCRARAPFIRMETSRAPECCLYARMQRLRPISATHSRGGLLTCK